MKGWRRTLWIDGRSEGSLYQRGKRGGTFAEAFGAESERGYRDPLDPCERTGKELRDDFDKYPLLWSRMSGFTSSGTF